MKREIFKKHPDYKILIVNTLKQNSGKNLKNKISRFHPNDIADALELLSLKERKKLYNALENDVLSQVFEYSDNEQEYLFELDGERMGEIVSLFETATAVELLNESEEEERQSLLDVIEDEAKSEIMLVGSFDEEEIGSKMSTNFISVLEGSFVKDAMNILIKEAPENDNIGTLYVVDSQNRFKGAVDLKELIIARKQTALLDITINSYPFVYADEDISACIERIKDYEEDSIPVLDSENRLIGVLTAQIISELSDEEMGEDYLRLAGVIEEEEINEPLKKSVLKRLPWLMGLLVLSLVVSAVVGAFEGVVASLTVIVSFQSLILGMSGNASTQSLAVTIRMLSNEELKRKEKISLIIKEAKIGLANGFALALFSSVIIAIYLLLKGEGMVMSVSVSLCSALSLLIAVFISSLTGTVVPILFKKLKIDPAVASGPLITTVNDLVAVVTYYGLALLILINMLKL